MTKTIYGKLGVTLEHLASMPEITEYDLEVWHVLVLRLYTTAAYWSLNSRLRARISISSTEARSLRKQESHSGKYPFPMTAWLIKDAILKLRNSHLGRGSVSVPAANFFRGIRNTSPTESFLEDGGCELAPCSTTTDLMVCSHCLYPNPNPNPNDRLHGVQSLPFGFRFAHVMRRAYVCDAMCICV